MGRWGELSQWFEGFEVPIAIGIEELQGAILSVFNLACSKQGFAFSAALSRFNVVQSCSKFKFVQGINRTSYPDSYRDVHRKLLVIPLLSELSGSPCSPCLRGIKSSIPAAFLLHS